LEPGPGNKKDNMYYYADMLQRDIHVFEGADIFATDHVEGERNERTKVGRLRSCPTRFAESGAPIGQAIIYDPHQAEKTRNRADANELETLRCSIYGKGIIKPGQVDGQEYNIVEALTKGLYLELVGKDGAGGHAVGLSESEDIGGNAMERDENVTEGEPREEDIHESEPKVEQEPKPEHLAEAEVEATLAETNLPKAFKAALGKGEYADADVLKAAIAEAVAEVKELTGSGQPFGQGNTEPTQPSEEDMEEAAKASFNKVMREVGLREV
jgi:hypothetical protein